MIGKLKRKFMILATVSMILLMAVLVLIMNLVNYSSVVSESDAILEIVSQASSHFFNEDTQHDKPDKPADYPIPRGMSPEVPYESRYFTATVSADGTVLQSDFSRIVSVDDDSAQQYIEKAVASGSHRGFIGNFRYEKQSEGDRTSIVFLDCGRRLDAFKTFLWTSVSVGCFGCMVVFLVFLFAAGRIVRPIAESYEKQKRFISDAGHEIKTPLTIISANVDLMECDGQREELDEIRQQTKRLAKLTNRLVYLSKMEESEHTIRKTAVSFSKLTEETAESFSTLAGANGIGFDVKIAPEVTLQGAAESLRELLSILLENAMKYTPEGGVVTLELAAGKKSAVLTVLNTTADEMKPEELEHVFDRFYRTDASRNSATGGHGIGLSIAKAIAEAHGGTISAATKNGYDFCITAVLPMCEKKDVTA